MNNTLTQFLTSLYKHIPIKDVNKMIIISNRKFNALIQIMAVLDSELELDNDEAIHMINSIVANEHTRDVTLTINLAEYKNEFNL